VTDWNAVSAFMANVVAWPDPQGPGYINLHYSRPNLKTPGGKDMVSGWPFKDCAKFIERASWMNSVNSFKECWFCTGQQSQAGVNSKGTPKAMRGRLTTTWQKSIWIDIDVGVAEPGKPPKYATREEALAEFLKFQKATGLPRPSAIVFSGGGLHIYWISAKPLTPAEWEPYASGLRHLLLANGVKCDSGLTTDICRLLRVPGTFNHKYDPPRPVELSKLPLLLYNFDDHLSFLTKYAPDPLFNIAHGTTNISSVVKHSILADGVTLQSFGRPNALFKTLDPKEPLGSTHDDTLLKAAPIFKQCGFMKEALLTGGKDYDNALWMYSVLNATFMENGNAIAHAISKGHPSYSEVDTQALYDRKVAERADRNLGYPKCSTIQGAGCKACATCPLLAKGKSPLNIRPTITATVNPIHSGQTPFARELDLPEGYDVNDTGHICKVLEKTDKDGHVEDPIFVPLFRCIVSDPWVQKSPDKLNYTVTVDKGFTHRAGIPHSQMSAMNFKSFLAADAQRVLINTAGARFLEEFHLAWLDKLRSAAAAQEAMPFGWHYVNDELKGFIYGGNIIEDTGAVHPCGIGDPEIRRRFVPCGDIADWYAAAATVTGRKRPELTTIMLISFASPLIMFTGHNNVTCSVYGESASGKSSAYQAGMGVWGNIMTSKGSASSTRVGIINQIAEGKNLPYYWDEIKKDETRDLALDLLHEWSDGIEKARGKADLSSAVRRSWKFMSCMASNKSFREHILKHDKTHMATMVRVLEWHVEKIDTGPGTLPQSDVALIMAKLERSYGHMGLKYATYLAQNHVQIAKEVNELTNAIEVEMKAVGGGGEERYWIAAIACLTLAARYAKLLGVDVDEAEIKQFLYGVMTENRQRLERMMNLTNGKVDVTEEALTRYFKARHAQERVIWTDNAPMGAGKPKATTILKGPTQPRISGGGIEVRWVTDTQELIIAKADFDKFINDEEISMMQIDDALRGVYMATYSKRRLGAGTIHDDGREQCITIPVISGTSLWDQMMTFSSAEQKAAAEAAAAAPVAEGIVSNEDVIAMVQGATRG
jgi:hypothetical protein